MKAYKLLRILKTDGKLHPLFINKSVPTPIGVWMDAECHPTKGFAVRCGWHCCFIPLAPHLKTELSNGEKRVWVECEVEDWESYDRPESQGGAWILAQRMKINRILTMEEILKYGNTTLQNNRCNGIDIGCYDRQIDKLKYPLKLVSASYKGTYEECAGRSYCDPNQGFNKGYWDKDTYADYDYYRHKLFKAEKEMSERKDN